MCTGYRFELLRGVRVEGLCTCSCHGSGIRGIRGTSHAQNMVDDPTRFEEARLIGWDPDLEGSAQTEEDESK